MILLTRPVRLFLKLLSWGLLLAALAGVVLVLPWRWMPPPTTSFMLVELLADGRRPDYRWVPLERIAPCMAIAAVAAEDQKFPSHRGFDFESIADALRDPPGSRRGASTISQQVAKNLFLWGGRSYVRKAMEAYLTVFIELLWPKRRILEVYLNVVEFGPGTYGVGAAGPVLRGKDPAQLSSHDCAVLAAVLPAPKRMSAARPSVYVRGRAEQIQKQVDRLGGPGYLAAISH